MRRESDYILFIPSQTLDANKNIFSIFLDSASANRLFINTVKLIKQGQTAITGTLAAQLFLTRLVNPKPTNGSVVNATSSLVTTAGINPQDTQYSIPSDVEVRLNPTVAVNPGPILSERQIFVEETGASSYDNGIEMLEESIMVRPNQGLRLLCNNNPTGSIGINLGFSLRRLEI